MVDRVLHAGYNVRFDPGCSLLGYVTVPSTALVIFQGHNAALLVYTKASYLLPAAVQSDEIGHVKYFALSTGVRHKIEILGLTCLAYGLI